MKTEKKLQLKEFLYRVSALIREKGWKSSSTAFKEGTDSTATTAYFFSTGGYVNNSALKITNKDKELTERALHWIEEKTKKINETTEKRKLSSHDEFLLNLKIHCDLGNINLRNKGIIASLIALYNKSIQEKEKAKTSGSNHYGEIKERYDLLLKVTEVFQSKRGFVVYKAIDSSDNIFVWFTNKFKKYDTNSIIKIKATIKSHGEFRGIKQTTINRIKVLEIK